MNDSIVKTLGVAFAICLICSLVVSSTAVSLRDMQNENKANDKRTKILQAAGIFNPELDIKEQFNQLEEKYLDFNSGKLLRGSDLEVFLEEHNGDYDQIAATRKPEYSTSLNSSEDIAIIKNRENVGKFFILRNKDNSIDKIILPVRGYGLWGTLFGYISIEEDFNTVAGLEFYDHKETPGLGAEVDNPKWKALWPGKQLYKNNIVSLEVIKGKVPVDDKNLDYKVDGLSGATLTSRGVTNMLKYWFSDSGYANLFSELEYES
ncbi:Na(+)-translocating NADH-quinone reductase subunit C [Gammaproteobacteria bacterium]|nr:Na(+)-translocating NADH-quinone reductase subunit C [Gammaproteobacteria bacterium]